MGNFGQVPNYFRGILLGGILFVTAVYQQMKAQFCIVAKEIPRALQMETCLLKSLEWLHYFHYLLGLFYIRFVAT